MPLSTATAHSLEFGSARIRFRLHRTDRKKTVLVAVEPAGRVLVRAPRDLPERRVLEIVRRKGPWIVERVRREKESPSPPRREFVSGESCPYAGRNYRLKVIPAPRRGGEVKLVGGRFRVTVGRSLTPAGRARVVRAALIDWYRRRAEERLPERAAWWARRLGLPPPPVLIRDQRRRWGSCDGKGRIRLNWRIVMAPRSLADYVVAHEACHLHCPNHENGFWKRMRTLQPDFEARRRRLHKMGPSFTL